MTEETGIPREIPDPATITQSLSEFVDDAEFKRSERIGVGAKSEVYKKTLPGEVPVAIKLPKEETVGQSLPRTLTEAENWSTFADDQYVVSLFDYGVSHGQPWIAMEYMDGGHLGTRLQRGEITSLKHVLWIAYCIAAGLDSAHGRGVAHQDVKPKNVLFQTVSGSWDVPKVGDWGTATVLLERHETIGDYTPWYAAPEQHTADVDPELQKRIDVYQLGIIIYMLLTGEHPFGRSTEVALTEEPDPPSRIRPGIPSAVDSLVMKCLQRNPEDRFRDVRPIMQTLDDFLEQLA
ncbi:serine/threonine protein kinase (plasmid) [Halarchaeum sp. CBA1220]|uniref:serine/threonine-protein kinase n=1 Tax=Halarchaeum sp. CBA1220 TaxID=1853682 RepID=UPI000F3A9404|nr:serine/threonine-protein kinase [Halarchaeum sp. CBA1220]QLC35574.1 serine/threonine protein kinase [Halarchaeum sp. CBA1220]